MISFIEKNACPLSTKLPPAARPILVRHFCCYTCALIPIALQFILDPEKADNPDAIQELYQFWESSRAVAAGLPVVVKRLKALKALHQDAAQVGDRLKGRQSSQCSSSRFLYLFIQTYCSKHTAAVAFFKHFHAMSFSRVLLVSAFRKNCSQNLL